MLAVLLLYFSIILIMVCVGSDKVWIPLMNPPYGPLVDPQCIFLLLYTRLSTDILFFVQFLIFEFQFDKKKNLECLFLECNGTLWFGSEGGMRAV